MPRRDGTPTTSERGLGARHQASRANALPAWLGLRCPCPGCKACRGRCMTTLTRANADFDHAIARALGGTRATRFLCRRCNRSRGATLGNQLKAARRGDGTSGSW